MRLLKKNEVDKLKELDRQREIAEGLKLSRRVDNLRQLAAEEESVITKFRDETLISIRKETQALEDKKGILSGEIRDLEGKLKKLSPEISAERSQIVILKKKLSEKEDELDRRSKELDLKEIDYAVLIKRAEEKLSESESREKESEKLHKEAEQSKESAKNMLETARRIEERASQEKNDAETWAKAISNEIIAKTKELDKKEEGYNIKLRELNAKEVRLVDREKTLERELQRIRANRI